MNANIALILQLRKYSLKNFSNLSQSNVHNFFHNADSLTRNSSAYSRNSFMKAFFVIV